MLSSLVSCESDKFMPSDLINIKVVSIIVTICLWYWNIRREQVTPSRHKNRTFNQNRLASIAFLIFIVIELIVPLQEKASLIINVIITLASVSNYLAFAIYQSQSPEDFWRKRRNQIAGTVAFVTISIFLSQFVSAAVMIPALFALLVAHTCYSFNDKIFFESLHDFEAVQNKLIDLDAKVRVNKLITKFEESEKNLEKKIS
ncbi:MAG: hypothetical protein HQK54_11240 [Oligoflexales bacterium]|nr:hypothetical protein [Oligoflexales bacterium]